MSGDIVDKLFVAMFTDNDNERRVACDKLVAECERRGWHPTEIKLLYGNNLLERQHRALEEVTAARDGLAAQNGALQREVDLLRKHASPQVKRRVRENLAPPKTGKVFTALVADKLFRGKKPRDWRQLVAQFLGQSELDIKDWEQSKVAVPGWVTERLQDAGSLPVPVKPPRRRRTRKARATTKRREKEATTVNGEAPQPALL
jgi:hypothetical protein